MPSINRVFLAGRITRDPEKIDKAALPGCRITVATNHWIPGKNGAEGTEEVCFIDCVIWGKQAESSVAALRKGSQVAIEGRLKLEKWTEKDTGKERSRHSVFVYTIIYDSPSGNESVESAPLEKKAPAQPLVMNFDSDLPF
jgi:single-strand DNA-binding protein